MNIHEHQGKQILKKYGVVVPKGVFAFTVDELIEKVKSLKTEKFVLKAQIHAGGRGKARGVKILNNIEELIKASKELLGKKLITPQTGPKGREVKRLYVEESSSIEKEFYLSCLVDRSSSKIAFISSDQGGMDIEEVAKSNPKKITTTKVNFNEDISIKHCEEIIKIFNLKDNSKLEAISLIKSIYKMFLSTDASLVEINPLILTKDKKIVCLDAKINFDDNAVASHPDILALRDEGQEDEKENKAQAYDLNYITLDGSIGCMVNGAGLAMATMDLVKLKGGAPANFLDVGGGTNTEKVCEAFKLILSDHNVKAVLVNIFGGIVQCDIIAKGILTAVDQVHVTIPVVVRLEGTNAEQGRELLNNSDFGVFAAEDLASAAEQVVALAKEVA